MTLYRYTGRSAQGDSVKGQMEGDSAEGVALRLTQGGIIPIDIISAAATEANADLVQLARRAGLGRPRTSDLILLTRQLYTITKSGIPLLRGLRGMCASMHNVVLRETLEDMIANLEAGRDLASSFARHPKLFSPLYVGMITVGEATGTLENSFLRLGQYLAQEQDLQDRVKSALRYPTVVVIVIAIAIGVVTTFVIPKFAPLFRALGNQIPLPTRIIMATSQIAQRDWPVGLGLAVLGALIVKAVLRTQRGRYTWHKWRLRIPVVGTLMHQAGLARVTRTLSVSLAAGMPMLQTLAAISRGVGNDYIAERINLLRETVERGEPLARAAATIDIFPPLVLQMIAVGEEAGELPDLLDEVAGFYEREVDYALKNLSAAVEPILIICVGAMVLILALGVFLPMWDLIAKVGSGH